MSSSMKKTEQVYRWVMAYIDKNKFSNNQKIPSENAICRRLNVSRETVRAALDCMAEEGLIYKVRGSGTFFNKEVSLSYNMNLGTQSKKIGLVLQGQDRSANSALIDGIHSVLPKDKIALRTFFTDNKFSNERRCLQTIMQEDFDGFIIDGVKASILNPNLDCYEELGKRKIPVVFYNNYYSNLRCPHIIVNDFACAEQLVGKLIEAGHRNIAGIFVYDNYQSVAKFQVMVHTMQQKNIEFQDDYIKWCISNEAHDEKFVRVIQKFLKSLPKCTAIVCCNCMIYRLVRKALQEMGKQVPKDYSLVCFDYSLNDWEEEGIVCSIHPGYEMGVQAAKCLIKMLSDKDCGDSGKSRTVSSEIYLGNSICEINTGKSD